MPELITAGEATKAAMELLLPELRKKEDAWQSAGKFVIGTVEGDMRYRQEHCRLHALRGRF